MSLFTLVRPCLQRVAQGFLVERVIKNRFRKGFWLKGSSKNRFQKGFCRYLRYYGPVCIGWHRLRREIMPLFTLLRPCLHRVAQRFLVERVIQKPFSKGFLLESVIKNRFQKGFWVKGSSKTLSTKGIWLKSCTPGPG